MERVSERGNTSKKDEEMMECCCGYRQNLTPSASVSLTGPVPHSLFLFSPHHRLLSV